MPAKYRKRKVKGTTVQEHRVVWEEANGPIPEGMVVHHRNGDRYDNRLENLELLSHQAHSAHHNQKHPLTKVCANCGEEFTPAPTKRARQVNCSKQCWKEYASKHFRNNAKLSREQHAEIRRRLAAGERGKDLALEYEVSPQSISRIKHAYDGA